jgi:tetratricopeptide (TPR) repeat protein
MMHYELSECFKKYGASQYLSILRKRFIAGLYTKAHFAFLAAEAYFFLGKPIRALTLLKSVGFVADAGFRQRKLLALLSKNRDDSDTKKGCSLNMIAKNESVTIGGALDSVDAIMDEIIVCDTGSTDGTIEIAGLYGATILSTPWQNDFSAARNEAIKASTRPWIFWMDADDRLKRESQDDLAAIVSDGPPQAAALCIVNEQNNTAGARFLQVRLFPRRKGLLFERRIHEQIMFSVRRHNIPFTRYPGITIIHTGYNDILTKKQKAIRNALLIEHELHDHPEDPALLLNYGDCHWALDRLDRALGIFQRITKNMTLLKEYPDVFIQAHFNIGCIYHSKKDLARAKQWLSSCIRLDATRIEAFFMLGRIFDEEKDLGAAFDCYYRASRIEPPIRQTATNDTLIRMESILRISRILISWDRSREAELLLTKAAAAFPHVVEYHSLLGQAMLKQQKLKEAARSFMQSLSLSTNNNEDACNGMATIYKKLNDPGKAKMFLELIN